MYRIAQYCMHYIHTPLCNAPHCNASHRIAGMYRTHLRTHTLLFI
jgi:hypothetical protein